jgi:hypothetical protein
MKPFAVIIFILILSSCGESRKDSNASVTDKKVELEGLKKQQTDIAARIIKLEEE